MSDCELGYRIRMMEGDCRDRRIHEKYKNKCESPKAATTEGTTSCYTEADACAFSYYERLTRITVSENEYLVVTVRRHERLVKIKW